MFEPIALKKLNTLLDEGYTISAVDSGHDFTTAVLKGLPYAGRTIIGITKDGKSGTIDRFGRVEWD